MGIDQHMCVGGGGKVVVVVLFFCSLKLLP